MWAKKSFGSINWQQSPLTMSAPKPPCTSPKTPVGPSAASTTAATTSPADERLARLQAFQIASEMLSIKMKRQEAALAQGGMLPR